MYVTPNALTFQDFVSQFAGVPENKVFLNYPIFWEIYLEQICEKSKLCLPTERALKSILGVFALILQNEIK